MATYYSASSARVWLVFTSSKVGNLGVCVLRQGLADTGRVTDTGDIACALQPEYGTTRVKQVKVNI